MFVAGIFSQFICAHELIVSPAVVEDRPELVSINVLMTEVYNKPGRLPPGDTTLQIWKDGSATELSLSKNNSAKQLYARAISSDIAGSLLTANVIRNKKSKKQAGLVEQQYYVAKALWEAEKDSDIAQTVMGNGLEITIQSPLADLRIGEVVSFKVLLHGQAVEARLMLAKDGASEEEHAYIFRGKSDSKGMAKISFDSAGTYMLRSKVKLKPGEFPVNKQGADNRSNTEKVALMELSGSFVFQILE